MIQQFFLKIFLLMMFACCCFSSISTPPGLYIGVHYGKPFPAGTYLSQVPSYISLPTRPTSPSTNVFYNSSSLNFVPKLKIFNANTFVGGSVNEAFYRSRGGHAWIGNIYNSSFWFGLQWLISPHIGFSNIASVLPPMNTQGLSVASWVFLERAAITYFDDQSKATVHFTSGFSGPNQSSVKPSEANWVELDFTYVRIFEHLTLGPIAYGSWDTTLPNPQSQFAVGGIIGYSFEKYGLQLWLAKDTNSNNWGNYATTGFLRFFILLDSESHGPLPRSFFI